MFPDSVGSCNKPNNINIPRFTGELLKTWTGRNSRIFDKEQQLGRALILPRGDFYDLRMCLSGELHCPTRIRDLFSHLKLSYSGIAIVVFFRGPKMINY